MSITVKMTENGSIVTVHNPKKSTFFQRPLLFTEIEAITEYGEEYGLMLLQKKVNDSNKWNNYKLKVKHVELKK